MLLENVASFKCISTTIQNYVNKPWRSNAEDTKHEMDGEIT
jgi:hypothetical protein